jgi:NAD-dependent SIR2 family protein deacetylase
MQKPPYELGPLRAGVTQCRINIDNFQRAIDVENQKIIEYQGYIQRWEAYNKELSADANPIRPSQQDN